jgi:hypothetical protein
LIADMVIPGGSPMDHREHDPVTIEALLAKVEDSRYRELLHDDQLRRRLVVKMLAESDDPMLREMGEQLRDGLVKPSQLMSIPEYWEALGRGYEALGRIDLDQVAEQVDATADAPSDDPSAAPEPPWDEHLRREPPTIGAERERGR